MKHRFRSIALLAVVAALAPAALAQAEPARTITFSASGKQSFSPSGSGFVGFSDGTIPVDQCTPGARDCDDTLVKLDSPGVLTVTITGGDSTQADVALDVFESDASGTPGRNIKHADGSTPVVTETVTGEFEAGYYIIRIDFLLGQGAVNVDADFVAGALTPVEGGTPPTATPGAGTNAKPTATVKVAKKIKAAKLKGFGGTASDDGSVAKVEVGLLQLGKGGKCKQLTSAKGKFAKAPNCKAPSKLLTAKGTTSWSLKLGKKLAKGKYVVVARATDDKGEVSAISRQAFTVS